METGVATRFVLGSLATWRVSHLLAEEDGPADVVVRVRARLGSSQPGELMDCFACTSVWVAAPIAAILTRSRRDLPLVWLALSGAACLLEWATARRDPAPAAPDPEGDAHVLWREAQRVEE
jgi:hypothetical protein